MKGFAENLKSIIIILLVVALALLSSFRLMKIQVVGDKEIATPQLYEPGTLTYTKGVKATRGEIMDSPTFRRETRRCWAFTEPLRKEA